MSNTIKVPKEIFENIFFKEGGLKKVLAGGVQLGLDKEKPVEQPNAEIEQGEWILDSKGLRIAEGDKHKDGGIDVLLEDRTKILSNYTPASKEIAKRISEEYEAKFGKKPTYAEILTKTYQKLGLNKLQDEQEKVIDKLDKQQKNVKDANTLNLNTQVLSEEINRIENEKAPGLEDATKAFNQLFKEQEDNKPKEEQKSNIFQPGGSFKLTNKYANPDLFRHQSETPRGAGNYGEVDKAQTAQEIKRLYPFMFQQYFGEGNLPKNTREYQEGQNVYYQDLANSAKNLYGETSPKYKEIVDSIQLERFETDDSVRGIEGKFGNYSSTRPNYQLELLPEDIQKQMQAEGINTYGQLAQQRPDIAEKYVSPDLKIPQDVWLGAIPTQEPIKESVKSETGQPVTAETTPGQATTDVQQPPVDVNTPQSNNLGLLATPVTSLGLPQSMQSHLKASVRAPMQEFQPMSPDQQLYQLQQSKSETERNLDMLPPAQRAAVIANVGSTYQDKVSEVIGKYDEVNNQGFTAVKNFNNQSIAKQEALDAQNALNYEQRQLLAQAKTDQDVNRFFTRSQEDQARRSAEIEALNLLNAQASNFQFTDQGIKTTGDYSINLPNRTQQTANTAKTSKKSKKRFGGVI